MIAKLNQVVRVVQRQLVQVARVAVITVIVRAPVIAQVALVPAKALLVHRVVTDI